MSDTNHLKELYDSISKLEEKKSDLILVLEYTEDRDERSRLQDKISDIDISISNIRDQLNYYSPDPVTPSNSNLPVLTWGDLARSYSVRDILSNSSTEYTGITYDDIGKYTWGQISRGETFSLSNNRIVRMKQLISKACNIILTPKQSIYINEHYIDKRSYVEIAARYNVSISSVSNTVSRAINAIQMFVDDMQLAERCTYPDSFDWISFLKNSETVSARQAIYLALMVSDIPGIDVSMISNILDIDRGIVVRNITAALNICADLGIDVSKKAKEKFSIPNWNTFTSDELKEFIKSELQNDELSTYVSIGYQYN